MYVGWYIRLCSEDDLEFKCIKSFASTPFCNNHICVRFNIILIHMFMLNIKYIFKLYIYIYVYIWIGIDNGECIWIVIDNGDIWIDGDI